MDPNLNLIPEETVQQENESNKETSFQAQSHKLKERKSEILDLAKQTEFTLLKKRINRKYWLRGGLFFIFTIWLLIYSILYATHRHRVLDEEESSKCSDDTDCTFPKQYCDINHSQKCSVCLSSSHCTDYSKPYCDIYNTRSCHECLSDRDCGVSNFCDFTETRKCVQCLDNNGCASELVNKICDLSSKTCVECLDSIECSDPIKNQCSPDTHTCAQCFDNAGCSSDPINNQCDPSTHTCVPCFDNSGCSSNPTNKVCDIPTQTCVQCTAEVGCGSGYCDLTTNECVECLDNTQCGSGKVCDPSDNTCVECYNDGGCSSQISNKFCDVLDTNTCVQCVNDGGCALEPINNVCETTTHTCVECLGNSECSSEPTNKLCSSTHTCVECLDHGVCSSQPTNKFCSSTNECVQCIDNDGCSSQSTDKFCQTGSNTCVECIDNDSCSSQTTNKVCNVNTHDCVQCIDDNACALETVNKKCLLPNHSCVQCIDDTQCASQTINKLCDLTSNTCVQPPPCTPDECASRLDGKTTWCGAKCIAGCSTGFSCDIFQSDCVADLVSSLLGTNVPTDNSTGQILSASCGHCHETRFKVTGSLFKKAQLATVNYITGIEYLFRLDGSGPNPHIINAAIYFQAAPNCAQSDFGQHPYILLGNYPSITTKRIDFINVLPVTEPCFFVLTGGEFQFSILCDTSLAYAYQICQQTSGALEPNIDHSPFYGLYGY